MCLIAHVSFILVLVILVITWKQKCETTVYSMKLCRYLLNDICYPFIQVITTLKLNDHIIQKLKLLQKAHFHLLNYIFNDQKSDREVKII